MHTVDPEFKISYDLRNDQEASVMARRHGRNTQSARAEETPTDTANNSCPMFGPDGIRWMCLAGLAFLGFGVGLQLGVDQYSKNQGAT